MTDSGLRLEVLQPSRKKLQPGNIFAMKLAPHVVLHGRVIKTDAYWTTHKEAGGRVNLIYVYDHIASEAEDYDLNTMTVDRLLIAPVLINRLGWSRGYLHTVGNSPLQPGDILERHVFKGDVGKHYNEYADEVDPWDGITGSWGLASYLSLEDKLVSALRERGIHPPSSQPGS